MYPIERPVKKTVIITGIKNLGFKVNVHEVGGKSFQDFYPQYDVKRLFDFPDVYETIVYVRLSDGNLFEVDSLLQIYKMNVPVL